MIKNRHVLHAIGVVYLLIIAGCGSAEDEGVSDSIMKDGDKTKNQISNEHSVNSARFAKLDENGEELSDSVEDWHCVHDSENNLIWEGKYWGDSMSSKEKLHYYDDRFNWHDPDFETNGGRDGSRDDDGAICFGYQRGVEETFCNTYAYANRVNEQEYCGINNWRLPTHEELKSLVDKEYPFGAGSNVVDGLFINENYFPRTDGRWFYWTSTRYEGGMNDSWGVHFRNGKSVNAASYSQQLVRLVSGECKIGCEIVEVAPGEQPDPDAF